MALVKLNVAFKGFSNKIGSLIFYEYGGDVIVRANRKQRDPKTPLQLELRDAFRKAVKSWQQLSEDEKYDWNRMSKKKRVRGYNLYISTYMLNRWDQIEITESASAVIPGTQYHEETGASPVSVHPNRPDPSIPLRCPVVAPSFPLYDSLYAGSIEL